MLNIKADDTMNQDQYYLLMHRHFTGEATEEEEIQLREWLNTSEEHRKIFADYQKLWKMIAPPQPEEGFSADKEWLDLSERLNLRTSRKKDKIIVLPTAHSNNRMFFPTGAKWAALAASLILALGSIFYLVNSGQENWQMYATKRGERKSVMLPDHSRIRLNVDSKIEFPAQFPDSIRIVRLSGEALFEVAHEARPFVVQTENARLQVLGTHFNVYARNQKTRVIVLDGKVALQSINPNAGNPVIVTKNQMSSCIGNLPPESPQTVDTQYCLGWLNNKITFLRTPLKEITEELERIFDVNIEVANPAIASRTVTISGISEKENVESIISSICMTLNLKYIYRDGEYRIVAR